MRVAAFAILAAACGDSSPELPARPVGPPAAMVATSVGPEDVVVAEVAGRPVWGSCVRTQAETQKIGREAALRECVDFELLAQAAEARGLATHPEVVEETRRVLVSRFVEIAFERTHRLEDMLPEIDKRIAADPMNVIERRNSAFIRVPLPNNAAPDVVIEARILADKIHAELAEQTGLFENHLDEVATRVAAGSKFKIEVEAYQFARRGQTVPAYEAALFAIPEVGRVSPVTRTPWGWDIVLLTDRIEGKKLTREEVLPIAYERLRAEAFDRWVDGLVRDARITRNLAALEQAEQEAAP